MNTIGNTFRFTSFGESHGPAIGGIIDGCPSGMRIDISVINAALQRRCRTSFGTSQRAADERDEVEWLSGLLDGVTLGTPIAFLIRNTDARSSDYEDLADVFRPGHADEAYQLKYGIRDYRGGGRASARETAARVVAGCIAMQIIATKGIKIEAEVVQVGKALTDYEDIITQAAEEGDSVGGVVRCLIKGMPAGIGEPVFGKLQSQLAAAMMSIPACRGFFFGHIEKLSSVTPDTIPFAAMRGSANNKLSDGISGGITDGADICFSCVFKPTPSISQPQMMRVQSAHSVSDNSADDTYRKVSIKGRHDVCVAMRAAPVVEAMAALVLADNMLSRTTARNE